MWLLSQLLGYCFSLFFQYLSIKIFLLLRRETWAQLRLQPLTLTGAMTGANNSPEGSKTPKPLPSIMTNPYSPNTHPITMANSPLDRMRKREGL